VQVVERRPKAWFTPEGCTGRLNKLNFKGVLLGSKEFAKATGTGRLALSE